MSSQTTEFADKALPWLLNEASLDDALDFYRSLYNAPGCDNAALAEIGKGDRFFLLTHLLGRADMVHPWLYARCREVELDPDDRLDLWAREHGKSSVITFGGTVQDILQDPEVTCGIFSHSRPIAKQFLRQIKRELEANERLKALYPDILWGSPAKEAPKWSEDEGIIVKRKGNPKEATVEAWGLVDGQPVSKHFKRLVYDDVVTRESVTTPEMIKKTTEALELSYALGSEGGSRRWAGTRYHFNDSYRTVMDRGTAKPRVHAATVDGSPDGEPVLMGRDRLAKKRRDMGPYTFGAQMLLNPTADETQGFREEWLKYHDGFRRDGLNVYLVFDPASSKKKSSDYTAAWAVGIGPDGNYYILDMVRDRLNLTQRAQLVMAWHRRYRPMREHGVRYEQYGMQADIDHIRTVQKDQNYRFEITEVGGKTPKADRIKRLIPLFEQGKVYLPRSLYYTDCEGKTRDLIQEFVQQEYKPFPVPIHDDMLDALARICEPDLPLIWPEEMQYDTADLEPPTYAD